MAGKCFCVSFSDPRDGDWCLEHGQSVMWDCGAYSAHTKEYELSLVKYYDWLEPRLGHPHFGVVPDVIDGTITQQKMHIASWPFRRDLGAPVWHVGLPIDWLCELADEWPKVCFGSSGRYWKIGTDEWCRRIDEAFNALAKRHNKLPWIHMLRGMSLAGERWPFASTDSVNVSRNFKDIPACPERMARRLDAIQCPVSWELVPEQIGLLFEGGFYERAIEGEGCR